MKKLTYVCSRLYVLIGLLLISNPVKTQVQPIIDNGFLSYQGWAGAIHPSGDFVVRADRSVIHAYDRHNHMLFQSYQSPCIAELIRFTADGKYMIVQTGGEIDDECYRALVYDFYTGALLLNEPGMHINNVGPGNLVYLLKNIKIDGQYDHKELNVYDPGKGIKPVNILYDSIIIEYTALLDKKDNEIWYNIEGHYTMEEIKAGKIKTGNEGYGITEKEKASLDSLLLTKTIEFDVKYFKEKSVSGIFDDADFRLIAGPYLLTGNHSGVYIWKLENNEEVAVLDSVMIFGYNYLEDQQKLILKGSHGELPAVAMDLKTGAITQVPTQGRFYYHALYENDSTVNTVYVNDSYITVNKYYTSNPQNPILYKTFSHGLSRYDLFSQGNYYSHIDRKHKLVLHNNGVLIDLNDYSVSHFDTKYDTTLVHPAIIRFSPEDSSLLTVNEWKWHHKQARQFEKTNVRDHLLSLSPEQQEKLAPGPVPVDELNHYFSNAQHVFNYSRISNPFRDSESAFSNDAGPRIESSIHAFLSSGSSYKIYRDSLLVAEYDTSWIFARLVKPKEIKAHESAFKKFADKYYTEKNMYRLNNRFPDYLFPQTSYLSTQYTFRKPCEPVKGRPNDLLYRPYCRGKEETTSNLEEMRKKFAATLVKPLLTFDPLTAKPVYCINLLNTEEVPDLTYAGISRDNDVYFYDVVLPLHNNKQVLLNYAHGIFELQESTGKTITRSSLYDNGEFIHVTPDGYYFASKNRLGRISIRMGNKVYPIEQFDLKYNRPDIVLKRLGCTDQAVLDSYHKAYLKRLKKMNFTEDMLKDDFHLPELYLENKNRLPLTTDSSELNLDLRIRDDRYTLDRINVLINGVPVFGTNGIDLRNANTKTSSKKIPLQLCPGENQIQLSVLNSAGAESYKENIRITCQANTEQKPDLYLVTIGDSKYKDNRYDLAFAAKDAEDISRTFAANTNNIYGNIYSHTLTNEKVTRAEIRQVKEKLQHAKRNDVVIITVAGHGVLDKNYNYYLATHDMDFNDPGKAGLPYEELEALLDGIAPLKKTILIDACHSGEVDKDEVEQLTAQAGTTSGNVKFRTAGAGIQQKNLGLKSTSELMGELFTDLRKGTGATVISSASGVEYAMESDEWQNGLFTYCLLHGIKDNAADLNADGQVWLLELQQYLRNEVTRLSKGKQQPTSRIENTSMDFRIW